MVNVKVDYKFVGDIGGFKQQVELHKLWLGSIYISVEGYVDIHREGFCQPLWLAPA
jgi:hypothetical protein